MPVKKVKGGYKWGTSGKVYPTRAQAEKQARAAYASGYKGSKMKKPKKYVLGGAATPEQGEQSKYRPSAMRSPQGMMSARGMTSGMAKMYKGGYCNPVTIVDNLKKKKKK